MLTDATNRAIVAALDDSARKLTVDELAERVVSEDGTGPRASASEEAGLLEYDRDENLVTRGTHSTVDAERTAITAVDELLERFRA
ncbi:hypothetical protein RBH26_03020 [Natronolimnohabitans sp. A-GB9]|uniref:hypothetical protein n=1 Tax=Natronolimnohabitans sp. A-GB9 TaxID=3069757 RepID=UPI0027B29BC8|nr:hypothetical protein [Natronolimnohabitans sp. A-GB9]MDQ2049448.1 hypothetical protein [Natronolimnohabitans sp. A-GB9]